MAVQVTIVGPLFDASGYAYHTRTIALWLERLGARVTLRPVPWGAARIRLDASTASLLDRMMRRPEGDGPVVYITVANAFQKEAGRPTIGWTMLESDRIPPLWVAQCNGMDEVWVPTRFNQETFARSGVDPGKIHLVPLGCDPDRFHPDVPPMSIPGRRGFAFLANFEWIPRKGYDILLRAYLEEFGADEDVCLILKTYDNSAYDPEGRAIRQEILRIVREVGRPDPAQVILLTRVFEAERLPSLYTAADCYVLPSRGEGWNHPAMEAAACGRPAIITGWSANSELFSDDTSYLIPVEGLEPVPAYGVPNDAVYGGSCWARPSLAGLRRLMRHAFAHRAEVRAKGQLARSRVARVLTWEQSARRAMERLARWAEGHGSQWLASS